MGNRPSFRWQCLMGAKRGVQRGFGWLVSDGLLLRVLEWLPRPHSFRPITPKPTMWANLKDGDLIDYDMGCWWATLVRQIFLDCDSELILNIPLCNSWQSDKLIWHYYPKAFLLYDLHTICLPRIPWLMLDLHRSRTSLFNWRVIWSCNVPSHIRLFDWRTAIGALLSGRVIARHVSSFSMTCGIRGYVEETNVYATLECPLAAQVWQGCHFDTSLWDGHFCTLANCLEKVN